MKEIEKIVSAYSEIDFKERKAALATVVRVQGSAYRRAGARMIMTDDGRWTGAISGGCLEGDALRRARQIINEGKPQVVRYDTMEDQSATSLGVGLGCNGIIDVLIEPISESDHLHHIDLLKSFLGKPRPLRGVELIATVFSSQNSSVQVGERLFLQADNQMANYISHAELSKQIQNLLPKIRQEGKSQSHTIILSERQEEVEVFIEILKPAVHLVLFGAGYDSIPLVKMAHEIGWYVTLADDCVAHLQPKRFPDADQMLDIHRDKVSEKLKFDAQTAAVLISHNYKFDLAVLKELLKTEVPYIGILGPKKRFDKMLGEIEINEEQIKKIHSPIGLDIGAETPEEIAIAILAEVQARFSKRRGNFLKAREGSIHERD